MNQCWCFGNLELKYGGDINNCMSKTTHTHHIIPKHMGGTDDPSNLVELTLQEHAEAHRQLWIQYGKLEDKVAYLMLSGKTEEGEQERKLLAQERQAQEDVRLKMSIYAKNRTQTHRDKLSEALSGKTLPETVRQKISEATRKTHRDGGYWESYSSEQKTFIVAQLSAGRKKRWKETSLEEKQEMSRRMNDAQKQKKSWMHGVEVAKRANTGRKLDKEIVKKRSEAQRRFYQTPEGKEMLRLRGIKIRESRMKNRQKRKP